jgi:hypothetical protein
METSRSCLVATHFAFLAVCLLKQNPSPRSPEGSRAKSPLAPSSAHDGPAQVCHTGFLRRVSAPACQRAAPAPSEHRSRLGRSPFPAHTGHPQPRLGGRSCFQEPAEPTPP